MRKATILAFVFFPCSVYAGAGLFPDVSKPVGIVIMVIAALVVSIPAILAAWIFVHFSEDKRYWLMAPLLSFLTIFYLLS